MRSTGVRGVQEYCVKCSLPLPIYDLQNTSGQPHQRNFDIIAKVGAIASNGIGTSKKDAKRDAATALLDKLKALGSEVAIDLEMTKKSDKPKSMPFAVKKEETGSNKDLKLEIKSEDSPFDVKKKETEFQNGLNQALKLKIKQE